MATVTHDDLWLCHDCHFAAAGMDETIIDQAQAKATEEGLAHLAALGHLVSDPGRDTSPNDPGQDVFMTTTCACCKARHQGLFNRYAILGEPPVPTYLDPTRVIDKRQSDVPPTYHTSQSGYGSKIPSSWELKLDDNRWRRVYIIQWSNMGTPYVFVGGERHLLGGYDPAHDQRAEAK